MQFTEKQTMKKQQRSESEFTSWHQKKVIVNTWKVCVQMEIRQNTCQANKFSHQNNLKIVPEQCSDYD